MTMRLLTLWSAPYHGGAAKRFVELVDGLSSRGTDLILLSARDYVGLAGVPVERIPLPQGRWRILRTRLSGKYSRCVDRIIEKHKPDVVFAFGLANGGTLFPSARVRGIPCVLFIRGMELAPKEYRRVPLGRMPLVGAVADALYARAFGTYARRVFRKARTVVFQNEAQYQAYLKQKFFTRDCVCSIRFLPNNSNPSWVPEGHAFRAVQRPVTVIAANLFWGKGFKIAIDAFRIVRERVPDARLIILGDGPEGEGIRRYASHIPGVSFHGHVTNVHEHFRRARLLLHPTLFELGSPNIVLEAAAWGMPMLVSDEVEHTVGARSWVYPARDHCRLADLWVKGLTSDAFHWDLCRESCQLGNEYRFDWVGQAKELLFCLNGEK